jgi:hypothetical protein
VQQRESDAIAQLGERLHAIVQRAAPALAALPETDAATPRASGKWSKKEILGHLIDSASNNHQRFVRVQIGNDLTMPGYDQADWVRVQAYASTPWADLVALWRGYNTHLARVIGSIPPEALAHRVSIGDNAPPVTLEFVARDYVTHLLHHLSQILPGARVDR